MATFDPKTGRYTVAGRILTNEEVLLEIKRIEKFFEKQSRLTSRLLFEKRVSIADWQIQMRDLIRSSSVLSAAIGHGGFEQMTPAKWGSVGGKLRVEYSYLNNFARQIEQGKVIFESQFTHRAQLYAKSFRGLYFAGEVARARAAGRSESKRVLHARESCTECLAWSRRGFVDIGDQPPIGTLKCRQFCLCTFEYA